MPQENARHLVWGFVVPDACQLVAGLTRQRTAPLSLENYDRFPEYPHHWLRWWSFSQLVDLLAGCPRGVRVNSVAPGSFPDPDQMSAQAYNARQDDANGRIPLGRVGKLKEPGYLCVFLASPAASYINGQILTIDGGMTASF